MNRTPTRRRKLAATPLVAGLFVLSFSCACQPSQTSAPSDGASSARPVARNPDPKIQDDANLEPITGTVESIEIAGDKLAVAFSDRAAIYYLERSNPQFDKYRKLLESSAKERQPIRFRYRDAGQVIVSVE